MKPRHESDLVLSLIDSELPCADRLATAIWPFHWLIGLEGALPEPVISAKQYPHVYAYVSRFDEAVKAAKEKAPEVKTLKGQEAAKVITEGPMRDLKDCVDRYDPLGLSEGKMVQVWPIDWGFTHKDTGALLALDKREVAISTTTKAGEEIRLHFPRINFRVKGGKAAAKL